MYLAFDIDGTVYDVGDIVVPSFEEGISDYIKRTGAGNISVPERETIVGTLGLPMDEIFLRLFPALPAGERLELMNSCTSSLVKGIRSRGGRLLGDVAGTLEQLNSKGHRCLVASNGRREYVMAILETWDLVKYFSQPMVFPEGDIPDKTALVHRYVEIFGSSGKIVMIGDRYTDRDAARENDIPFIGCAFGHAGEAELEGAECIVTDFSGIPGAVRRIEERLIAGKVHV